MNVLITGGSRGIGSATTALFIKKGHTVWSPSSTQLNLLNPVLLDNPCFDIVINNAGINPIKGVLDISDRDVMRVNYEAPLEIIQQCLPYMIKNNFGRIINLGSVWIDKAKPKRLAYSASKNALHSLTKALTAEYAMQNILTNTVSPGFIGTDLTYQNNSTAEIEDIVKDIPIGRLGTPTEVAEVIYQLTVHNKYITGQNLIIDGGYLCTQF
jgi:NAD(P)-dependent dehydrogenase (short-subunit alcohol dehydrogenase family)